MATTKGRNHSFHNHALSQWEEIGDLKETLTLSVSARGNGVCVYLPKDIMDVYGLLSGDMLKVSLRNHFRKRREAE